MPKIFTEYPNLISAISSKDDGPMGLSYQVANIEEIKKRRAKFLSKIDIDIKDLVIAKLVHGKGVRTVGEKDRGKVIPSTDALITKDKNVFLSITVADCMPIFFYDPKNEVVGLAHVGWRSLYQKIIANVIKSMKENFNSNPKDILAYIGPSIGSCHFEVKDDVIEHFPDNKDAIRKSGGKTYLDLWLIADDQLQNVGILGENIEITEECTYCHSDKYFSWRREQKSKELRTMMVVFGIKN